MDFQGFQNTLPLFVIVLIAVTLLVISVLSYKKLTSIPLFPRWSLIGLRFSTFILLLILFLNPYFFSSQLIDKNARIAVFLDDSESVTIKKNKYQGEISYRKALEALNLEANSNIELEYFTIGSNSKQIQSIDSLEFLDGETNLSNAISQLIELEDSFDASIILSDGIITFGTNPIIAASKSPIPLYTISLGDTSTVKDIIVNNVVTNPNGFINTKHHVDIEVAQNGFVNTSAVLSIVDSKGITLDQKDISFNDSEEIINETFEIELLEEGLKQFKVLISNEDNEWSYDNNSFPFSIDVSSSKVMVLDIAFEIHPDVKAIRSILSSDENIQLVTRTWINGSKFIEGALPKYDEFNLIVFHGLPSGLFDESQLDQYLQKPTLYFQLPKTRKDERDSFTDLSQINNTGNQLFEISIVPNLENVSHPILELPEIGYKNISMLVSSLKNSPNSPDVINLFKSSFQDVETDNAVISIIERGNTRRGTVSAWGWYKMLISPSELEREFVTLLFSNTTSWLASDPDNQKLKIEPSKKFFNLREEVVINANLQNESGLKEEDAIIELVIQKNEQDQRIYNMRSQGDGFYTLNLDAMTSGLYTFSATARKNSREIDSQTGEFIIEDSNTEFINTIRNDDLMRSLSNETNGKHFIYDDLTNFWAVLDSDGILEKKKEQLETYIFPVRNFFWFLIVLFLLGIEWILRKKYSLP